MLKIDEEFKSLIPALSKEEFEQLEKNCIDEGIREPIILWTGTNIIIDGHNRYKIAQENSLEFRTFSKGFDTRDEIIDWMINNQLGRRNLSKETMSYLRGLQYQREVIKDSFKGNQYTDEVSEKVTDTKITSEKLAAQHKVSEKTIRNDSSYAKAVDTITANTTPDIKQKILNREIEITKKETEQLSKLEPEKQKNILDKIISGEAKSFVDASRLIKKEEVHETPKIKGKYRVIYADCPWKYNDKRDGNTTGAEDHYPTMSISELCELPIKNIAEDNSVLFFWVTSPLLEVCFEVIKAWGFKYKASFIWDKIKHNMGHYNSVRHELLFICTRGSCTPENVKLFDSVQSIERSGKHSEKPEEFRNIINELYPSANKIELFSRKKVKGWDVWGNQS